MDISTGDTNSRREKPNDKSLCSALREIIPMVIVIVVLTVILALVLRYVECRLRLGI